MLSFLKILFIGIQLVASAAYAQQLSIKSLRHWVAPDHSRMVFDLSAPSSHKVFLLDNPARLVVDFKNTHLTGKLDQPAPNHPVFRQVRSSPRNRSNLRIVIDLKQTGVVKSLVVAPDNSKGHRLVVDLYPKKGQSVPAVVTTAKAKPIIKTQYEVSKTVAAPVARYTQPPKVKQSVTHRLRDVVIAIDAGHGGHDPGAHGPRGTREKHVTFAIAKRLAALINRKPGMKAVLVRKGDYYIELPQRMKIARAAKADLFISIHADAFTRPEAKGASVYTLSNQGATSETAKWLANHENSVDLVGGVSLDDKDDVLASVLLDLSMTATQEASQNVADKVLKNLGHLGHLHSHRVQRAGFRVLKSPDIPAILVETAFISNPSEENKLRNAAHQQKMALAIFSGLNSYFQQYAPVETRIARENQQHIISRGETLSGIAQQYGVSMRKIKIINDMNSNQVRIGQILSIPSDS